MATTITTLHDLQKAKDGSYYTVVGAGGDLQEWLEGYQEIFDTEGIGTISEWFQTSGAAVNHFSGVEYGSPNAFPADLVILLFPIDGLNPGKLAMLKLRMQDRWFDDVIDNMVR